MKTYLLCGIAKRRDKRRRSVNRQGIQQALELAEFLSDKGIDILFEPLP